MHRRRVVARMIAYAGHLRDERFDYLA